jgi:hypothetical protein
LIPKAGPVEFPVLREISPISTGVLARILARFFPDTSPLELVGQWPKGMRRGVGVCLQRQFATLAWLWSPTRHVISRGEK